MTECSAVLTMLGAREHREGGARLRSAGTAVPGVLLSIRDESGNEVARGETGEVWAKGGNFMQEYWQNPTATAEAFAGGWYHTGDAGYLDEDGYLFLVDRVKDMIVTGGENVYSAEVESVISRHRAVAQVAVIGIPHDTWGEQVHAVVVCGRRRRDQRRRNPSIRPGVDRWLQSSQICGVQKRAPSSLGRHEGSQTRATRAVLERPRPRRQLAACELALWIHSHIGATNG